MNTIFMVRESFFTRTYSHVTCSSQKLLHVSDSIAQIYSCMSARWGGIGIRWG